MQGALAVGTAAEAAGDGEEREIHRVCPLSRGVAHAERGGPPQVVRCRGERTSLTAMDEEGAPTVPSRSSLGERAS